MIPKRCYYLIKVILSITFLYILFLALSFFEIEKISNNYINIIYLYVAFFIGIFIRIIIVCIWFIIKSYKYFIKIIISSTFLYILFLDISLFEVEKILNNINIIYLYMAFLQVIFIRVIMACRWFLILSLYNINKSFVKVLSIIFISNSIGHLLPGGVGIDVVRSYQLSKEKEDLSDIVASVFIDRVIGLSTMLLVAFIASIIGVIYYNMSNMLSIAIGSALLLFMLFVKYASYIGNVNIYSPNNKLAYRLVEIISNIQDVVVATKIPSAVLIRLVLLSLMVQILRCIIFICIFVSMQSELDTILFFIFIPVLFILMLLPISIGGLGVREGGLFLFFGGFGASIEACTASGFVFYLLQLISLIPGLILMVFRK